MFDDPREFPEVPVDSILTLLAIGFLIASIGHLYRARTVIGLGLVLILVAVFVLPLVAAFTSGGG